MASNLNQQQQKAVSSDDSALLVLAGAGSGKTTVLAHRIAWLVERQGVAPYRVLAITFTNKAASEMRERVSKVAQTPQRFPWVGTFHSVCLRILRKYWREAGLPEHFVVINEGEKETLLRRILREADEDVDKREVREFSKCIAACKDQGRRELADGERESFPIWYESAWRTYDALCRREGYVDFGELILRVLELFQTVPGLGDDFCGSFQHVLVDEFQDTNDVQYGFLRAFTSRGVASSVVGDDDQLIYGWRGVRAGVLQRYIDDHGVPAQSLVRLEENYRSTANILQAANKVIANNSDRLGKTLRTSAEAGEPIVITQCDDENAEAARAVRAVRESLDAGVAPGDIAVLYRSNARTRVIETALTNTGISFVVRRGQGFFDRTEVRDLLAYVRLAASPLDNSAFERVINQPRRALGEKFMAQLRAQAASAGCSYEQALRSEFSQSKAGGSREQQPQLSLSTEEPKKAVSSWIPGRAKRSAQQFLDLMDTLRSAFPTADADEDSPSTAADYVTWVMVESGLERAYGSDDSVEGESRLENMYQLVEAVRSFDADALGLDELADTSHLEGFLLAQSLAEHEEGDSQQDDSSKVNLMTVHAAKGLEFHTVVLVGVAHSLFPIERGEDSDYDEERRLFYVAMTRAKRKLLLSCASRYQIFGETRYMRPSNFLDELPRDVVTDERSVERHERYDERQRAQYTPRSRSTGFRRSEVAPQRKATRGDSDDDFHGYRIGTRVRHRTFGSGVITDIEMMRAGKEARIQVNFALNGSKWLLGSIAIPVLEIEG